MLDRPEAAKVLRQECTLQQTLILYFAGGLQGHRVHWDERDPTNSSSSQHFPPMSNQPTFIRVSRTASPIDQCTSALYELFCFEGDEEFLTLTNPLNDKRKTREEFALSMVRHLFDANVRAKQFLLQHPITGV